MSLSQSSILRTVAVASATVCIAFGINAFVRPEHALTFFEWEPPTNPADKKMVDSLMAVYGARDIFMGLAIYSAAFLGTVKSLGFIMLAAGGVAFVDGFVCWTHGHGQWGHWSYAPILVAVGISLLGMFDRK